MKTSILLNLIAAALEDQAGHIFALPFPKEDGEVQRRINRAELLQDLASALNRVIKQLEEDGE